MESTPAKRPAIVSQIIQGADCMNAFPIFIIPLIPSLSGVGNDAD